VIIETQLRAMEIERYQSTFMNESCGNFKNFKNLASIFLEEVGLKAQNAI
jgi:hypothetical protein